ncbi:hypothetical protein ROE7235_02119 [Roseibaca ekhonensis]|uniref:Uncharacterized protein n=1 Tax=Roseinatronobacter ekhonensis TaxID=254356 RepID=A0A3B0M9M3_9RHOB|nr:hypothetical protein [Roseibaca ekhonensis]SUZ32363.1 hypothetical protein ROE7235_02119 [Roseibaca ekhonensis]
MLTISAESLDTLAREQATGARARLCRWLVANAPRFGLPAPAPQQAEHAVDAALELCLPNGIRREGDIARIALRAWRFGPAIMDQPDYEYLRQALTAETVDPDRRVMLVKLIEIGHKPATGPWHV